MIVLINWFIIVVSKAVLPNQSTHNTTQTNGCDDVLLYGDGDKVSLDDVVMGVPLDKGSNLMMVVMGCILIFGDKDHSALVTDNLLMD